MNIELSLICLQKAFGKSVLQKCPFKIGRDFTSSTASVHMQVYSESLMASYIVRICEFCIYIQNLTTIFYSSFLLGASVI